MNRMASMYQKTALGVAYFNLLLTPETGFAQHTSEQKYTAPFRITNPKKPTFITIYITVCCPHSSYNSPRTTNPVAVCS